SLNPVTDKCTGNGGNNWMDVKALKPGTAVVIVSYDKIVVGGNTALGGTYPETANKNYAVAIFNVGSELAKINWNIVGKDSWDAEFDTYYYAGDTGTFSIAPAGVESITVVSNGVPVNVEAEDGIYNVPVVEGNNLIWAEGSFGMACLPVRAVKIGYTFKNNTSGESAENDTVDVKVGDSVSVTLHGLNTPLPKMSGIYNPGYQGTAKNVATLNGSYTISSKGTQYDYISSANSVLTFDAIIPGQNVLDSFYTATSNMGDPAGNHRNTTDNGRSANFAAGQSFYNYNLFDLSIPFDVAESETPIDPSSLTKVSDVEIFAGPSSYVTSYKFTNAKDSNTSWGSSASAAHLLNAKVTTASYYNTIELSAWYDGDDNVYTTPLQSGIGIVVPADQFTTDPTKILNIVVTVTPGDTSLAEPNALHYMVYPGSANLKYVHPVITSLIAKDGDTDLPILPVVNTAETEYILEVGEAEKISLSAKQLQKYTNATNNKQDNADIVDVQLMKDGEPVGDAINVYPLTPDAYPVGSWALEDLDITGADQIQITVTSYVDKTTSRIYTIDLHRPATTFDVTLSVVNGDGEPTGMYAMDNATVTLLDDGTYLLRAHQAKKNRNLLALTEDKYEATDHEVDWYQADDDYYFVLPLSSLEDTLVAVFSSTSRVAAGNEFSNPMYISIVPDSIKESKKPDATVDDITILPAVAAVEIRSQYADSYLHAPLGEVVESDLAESYGYTDQVVGRVSALDALVRAQELTFGDAFTAETAADYLVVADNGYVTTLFGIESGNNGFLINMAVPNDGELQDWGGYNGLTVNQAVVTSGDLVDFYIYQDMMAMDSLTYIDAPEAVYTGKDITVNVSGITVGWVGYMYADGESMREDAKPLEGIKLGYLDPLTGAVEEIEDILTDEDGNATFKAPDTEGPIHLVAISNA
ncbi:MAG: hypothetical protein KBS83_05180, partial [Lachnospiraceae bacterium]|nr:hypothetical protein [Candidatus Equihabitans merdae]